MLCSNLEFLRGIERLGGSAGYQEHLESLQTIPNFTHLTDLAIDYTNTVWVTGEVLSFFIYSKLKVDTDEYTGKGDAWGLAAGGVKFTGFMKYNSWDEVTSAENSFSIVGAGVASNSLLIVFSINGHQVGLLTAVGLGASVFLGAGGGLKWTQDTYGYCIIYRTVHIISRCLIWTKYIEYKTESHTMYTGVYMRPLLSISNRTARIRGT